LLAESEMEGSRSIPVGVTTEASAAFWLNAIREATDALSIKLLEVEIVLGITMRVDELGTTIEEVVEVADDEDEDVSEIGGGAARGCATATEGEEETCIVRRVQEV